ncbi:MAG: hypothetical protein HOW73_44545 [Polyangiaceae bacterium]|nr:hypothetical protein [Polyangiaceae bacterium]
MRPSSFIALSLFSLALAACADDVAPGGGGSGGNGGGSSDGGAAQGGSSDGGASDGGASTGGAPQGGASDGGSGGAGGGSEECALVDRNGFGPCHCFTDDFATFNADASDDYWAVDGMASQFDGQDPAVALTVPGDGLYSGLYSNEGAPAANCFASVRVEELGTGLVSLEMIEATGSGPKVIVEVNANTGEYTVANVVDAQGNGELIGTGTVESLEGLRIQVRDNGLSFEILDTGVWTAAGSLAEIPAWAIGDVNFAFGSRDDADATTVFDDFNLDTL